MDTRRQRRKRSRKSSGAVFGTAVVRGAAAQKMGEAGSALHRQMEPKRRGRGDAAPQNVAKKRPHLVIGEGALLIADYFDRVGFLKISR